MNWRDLVCAACGGRVVEARCASCRAARDDFRSQRVGLPAGQLLVIAAALLAVLLVLAH